MSSVLHPARRIDPELAPNQARTGPKIQGSAVRVTPMIAWEPPGGDRDKRFQNSGPLRQVCRDLACQRLRDALLAVWGEIPSGPLVQPRIARGPAGRVLVDLAHCPGDVLIVGGGRCGARWPGQPFPG